MSKISDKLFDVLEKLSLLEKYQKEGHRGDYVLFKMSVNGKSSIRYYPEASTVYNDTEAIVEFILVEDLNRFLENYDAVKYEMDIV